MSLNSNKLRIRKTDYHAVFIRAPIIESVHGDAKVLASVPTMGELSPRSRDISLPRHFTLN